MGKVSNGGLGSGSTFIQQATLEKLKCFKCGRYLSVLPIYKNVNGDAICGRCPVQDLLDFSRDELYENAIEFQKFPCTNRESGCLETLFPVSLAEHEKRCMYMKHDCPTRVYNNCSWQGTLQDILDHFEDKHPTFILKDCKFEVDFVNNHTESYIMPYGEDFYIVTPTGDTAQKTFGLTVEYLGSNTEIDKYMYEVTLESGNNKSFRYSLEKNIGEHLELQGQIIREMLHDPITIVANINIKETISPSKSINAAEQSDNDDDEELDQEQLSEVECPICMEYMVPPIYQCETGHSICNVCKVTQSICPSCKAPFKKTQNFVVERIIMRMIYPCKHQGCKFKTKAKDIRQHEASCFFGPFICPLKDYESCSDIFRASELFNHIKKLHYENLQELDVISVPFDDSIAEDISEGYILKHSPCLFKICFLYKFQERKFCWSVQLIGPPEGGAKYLFELDIIDNSGRNMRMYLKAYCAPLLDKDETFQNSDNYVYLNYEQISKFIKYQLTYRVLITKKL